MELINISSKPAYDSKPLILLIGKFDGVHKGHQHLLKCAKEHKRRDEVIAIWSFNEHPLWIISKDPLYKDKLSLDKQKIETLKGFGVQRYYQVDFTKEYASITGKDFILEHLSRLNIKHIIVGDDFHFGKGAASSTADLIEWCSSIDILVTVVPKIMENGKSISSTSIRSFIQQGHIEAANSLLGKPYTITGTVVKGNALGRTLGFPTINLADVNGYVLPKPGVYLGTVEIQHDQKVKEYWQVLISAGYRPTVAGEDYLIEAYLIDYEGDLYGKNVSLSFLRSMRGEMKFESLEELIVQMKEDKKAAKIMLGLG